MKWYLKALIHKTLSIIPFGISLNHFFQKRYGQLNESNVNIDNILKEILVLFINPIKNRFGRLSDINIVEIGTGWIPFLPVTFALMGAKCKTFDVKRHLHRDLLIKNLSELHNHLEFFSNENDFSLDIAKEKCIKAQNITQVEDIMRYMGVHYEAPVDTAKLPIQSDSQDVTISRLVLQHIPPKFLPGVLNEFYRILKPGGISIHKVNLLDEYAVLDPNVTLINFLRYDSWFWDNFGNNKIKYINRERYPYYIELFERTGFRIIDLLKKTDRRSSNAISTMKIAKEFRHYSYEELATTGFNVVLEKPLSQ